MGKKKPSIRGFATIEAIQELRYPEACAARMDYLSNREVGIRAAEAYLDRIGEHTDPSESGGLSTALQVRDARRASAEETTGPLGDWTRTKGAVLLRTPNGVRMVVGLFSLAAWWWWRTILSDGECDNGIALYIAVISTFAWLVALMRK